MRGIYKLSIALLLLMMLISLLASPKPLPEMSADCIQPQLLQAAQSDLQQYRWEGLDHLVAGLTENKACYSVSWNF